LLDRKLAQLPKRIDESSLVTSRSPIPSRRACGVCGQCS
jgi:hypothetical protein